MSRRTHFELRAAMRELQITQKELATAIGVSPVSVYRWYHGKNDIPGYVWTVLALLGKDKVSRVLMGMPRNWIIEFEDVFPNNEKYHQIVKKFHPDLTRRDTNLELSVISEFKNFF